VTEATQTQGDLARVQRIGMASTAIGFWFVSIGPVIAAASDIGGLSMGWWRSWIGLLVLFVLVERKGQLSWDLAMPTLVPGICFGLSTSMFFWANQLTSIVNASLIAALQPIPIAIFATFVFGEVLTRRDLGWGVIAVGGAAMLALAGESAGGGSLKGDLVAAISISIGSLYFVVAKTALRKLDILPFMLGVFAWSTLMMTPVMLFSGQQIVATSGGDWIRVVGIGVLPGLGHVFLNYAQGRAPLKIMGLIGLTLPVSSTLLGLWFLNQKVSAGQAIAMAVVIAALAAHTLTQKTDNARA
jgi:drug/metabolite transporter (DMT)-like permease